MPCCTGVVVIGRFPGNCFGTGFWAISNADTHPIRHEKKRNPKTIPSRTRRAPSNLLPLHPIISTPERI
jgi:hypothetical protein